MSLRAVKHKFSGLTTPITSYDYTKTNLGTLIFQNTGANPQDKYVGPLPVGVARPMQEVVHTGNVATVSSTVVTGSGSSFTASMTGMVIGFGSTDPNKVTTWYTLGAWTSSTVIAITSGPTISVTTPFVIVFNFPMMYPHVLTYNSTIDWVFLTENIATASTPRRVCLYEFNKTTAVYSWKGFINITLLSSANANTTRGFRTLRYRHTTGTASVSGATVTGIGTTWQTERLAIGARIGFGSTDPTQISTWYYINAISSETSLTIQTNTTASGTGGTAANITVSPDGPYVIEELRFALVITQATTPTNGGLFLAKGISYADFVPTGTTIAVASATDNVKAVYWLSDAGTTANVVTNVAGCGCAIQPEVSKILHYAYVLDGFSSSYVKIYRYNLRATGTVTSGKMLLTVGSNSSDVMCTGNELVAGSVSGTNNGRIGTLYHGPGSGDESLYFATSTRVYRASISKIYSGNLDWISENRPEMPPGGSNSFPLTSVIYVVEIADSIDRLVVMSHSGGGFRHYVTKYPQQAGDPFDHIWGVDDKQQDQILASGSAYISSGTVSVSTTAVTGTNTFFTAAMVGFRIGFGSTDPTQISSWYTISAWTSFTSITLSSSAGTIGSGSAYVIDWNSNTVPHFNTSSQICNIWGESGIAHVAKQGTTSALNQIYSMPFGAHWTYTASTNQRVITPVMYTPDCAKYLRVVVTDTDRFGSGEFSISAEPFRVYFRTRGIVANSGEWTLVGKDGSLSGLSGSKSIQFMIEFGTIGLFGVPARIMSLVVVYDDTSTTTDTHYQPSVAKSSAGNKQFAWRFCTAFGGAGAPTLRVRLYDALTGDLLVDDNSATPNGTWDKSTNDGSSWSSYNNDSTDKGNETTFIRYTPASLGDNIKVRAVLTQQ